MKTRSPFCFLLVIFLGFITLTQAQTFHKGSVLISLSEGSTAAIYKTKDICNAEHPNVVQKEFVLGCRDPFIIEYGITNRIGIGLSSGNDVFQINSNNFYNTGFSKSAEQKVSTSEFTFDSNYHFYIGHKLDLSVVGSLGLFSVNFKGREESDSPEYTYAANGTILRVGMKARYYFFNRLGAFGMLTGYSASCSPKDVAETTVAKNYATNINGRAIEIGLCYRLF